MAPQDTVDRARLRPDRRVAHRDGRRRAGDQGRAAAQGRGRGPRPGVPFADSYRDDAREHGATAHRPAVRAVPGRRLRRHDLPRRCLPGVRLGGGGGRGRRRPRHRRGGGALRRRGRRHRPGHPPVLAEGQVEGGTLQAVGYATIEEIKLADGRYLNDRLATYIIPTALDAPRIDAILVEAPFSGAPHGAKGVGELPMDVGAPAVVAAIHDATGVWIHDLPATPERILAAMGVIEPPARQAYQPSRRRPTRGRRMTTYLTVNGDPSRSTRPGMRRLLDVLREDLGLTGTKEGCGEGRVRRLHRAARRRGRRRLPRARLPGRRPVVRTVEGLAGAGRARSTPCSRRSSRTAAPSAGSARRAC